MAHGGLVFVSGMLPITPSGEKVAGPVEDQVRQALENVEAVLMAAGSSRGKVLKCTVYVADIALWPRVNAAYAAFFGSHAPARAVVPCPELHFGLLVEIDAVAAVE
jgi:2-iminobutanoate/2-iminopropanoate deaminase